MATKKTTFVKQLVTQLDEGCIVCAMMIGDRDGLEGDTYVYLRLSQNGTYSNINEFTDDVALTPHYSTLLEDALQFAVTFKPAAAQNPTLIAYAFLKRLKEELTAAQFNDLINRQKYIPEAETCHSHDYCDSNEIMSEAMESIGLNVFLYEDGVNPIANDLWNKAWHHAKLRMAAMAP